MQVIDSDCHVMEPGNIWREYLPEEFKARAPKTSGDDLDWAPLLVDGVSIYHHYPQELAQAFQRNVDRFYPEAKAAGFSAQALISAMDRQGIHSSYLYPSLGLGIAAIDGQDAKLAMALVGAYNDWLFDYCATAPERLQSVPLITLHDVEGAVAEVGRVRDRGARAVIIRPNPVSGRTIGDRHFAPFWRTCNELGVSVALHEGCHTKLPAAGADRFKTHFSMHACCHPMEQMMAFTSLVENGVFEECKDLQVAFLESGAGWVPYFLWRLDGEYRHWRFQVPSVKRRPSEYFADHCYVSIEGCEPNFDRVVECVGEDRLLWGSDYPHPDHAFGEELAEMKSAPVPDSVKRQILWDNPKRFYRAV